MKFFKKIGTFAKSHKKTSVVLLVVIAFFGYKIWKAQGENDGLVRYVLAEAKRGALVSTINGTGQVSASNEVELTSKTSGDLVYLNAKVGQRVVAGETIGQVDASDAAFELESARISYSKLVNADPDEIKDAERNVEDAHTSAKTDLIKTSSDLDDLLASIDNILDGYLGYEAGRSRPEENLIDTAHESYKNADDAVDAFVKKYNTLNAKSTYEEIETLVKNAYDTALFVLESTKDTRDAVAYIRLRDDEEDLATADEAYTTINENVSTAGTILSTLASTRENIKTTNDTLKELKYPDTLDLRTEELNLREKEEAYGDHFIRTPFAGMIASVSAKKGDMMSNGTSIAVLITKEKVAEISLNEIDAAKIKVGQKATLTFDALDDFSINGEVIEIDLVGIVNQGVASYTVKISFDESDDRIRSGMTVNADIVTDSKEDVLMVPESAVKTEKGASYVEIVTTRPREQAKSLGGAAITGIILSTSPTRLPVETGISNGEFVEIISGLKEGQTYVARTIASSGIETASNQSPTIFGGGGNFRAQSVGGIKIQTR